MDYASYDHPSKQSFDEYGRSVKNGAKRNPQDLEGDGEFCVFTTVRWDPMLIKSSENAAASCNQSCPIYMLEHHWTRLQVAKWSTSFTRSSPAELLWQLLTAVQHWLAKNPDQQVDALRLKHKVYADSHTVTDIMPVPRIPIEQLFPSSLGRPTDPPPSPEWEIYLDDRPTEVSETTMYKTSERFCYDRARATAGIESYVERKEVLLFNPEGEIMDGSITSVYFWRDGQWVTPESMSGGQQGTTRRWTLQKKLCIEGKIHASDLREGEVVWLSNASKGYFRGRFVLNPPRAGTADKGP
ncbi:hypothetical protein KC315_g14881 [Hortaea werneckii]|nr:hypothetical protein KC315_g14881 [Hortaea werneckii]